MSNVEKSLALLGLPSEGTNIGETVKAYRNIGQQIHSLNGKVWIVEGNLTQNSEMKQEAVWPKIKKVLSYASSATGSGKITEISAAFVEIIEDFQQKAISVGSEDPQSAAILQKCEEYLPGEVGGNSYLLWAIDNYRDCCKLADDIADKEVTVVDGVEETEKINEIITGLRDMRGDMGQINTKLENLEVKQATGHQENVDTHCRIEQLEVKMTEIRQLAGARCLAEGQSVIRVINSFNREQRQGQTGKEEKNKNKMKQEKPETLRSKSPTKKMRLPPGSPTKRIIASPRKRLTVKEIKQTNRLEVFDVDQGTFNTSHKFQKEMENKEEDIEEIADEVSTNEMQGSSILSMD